MNTEKAEKLEFTYINEDRVATQKDLRILGLELEAKILNMKMELEGKLNSMDGKLIAMEGKLNSIENSLLKKLGALIVASSGILFALLTYFHT